MHHRHRFITLAVTLTLSACAGSATTSAPDEQPGLVEQSVPPATGSPASASVELKAKHSGLIKLAALAELQDAAFKATPGYPGKGFHLGAFTTNAAWQEFQERAQLPLPAVDFDSQLVVYAVLDAQTNRLGFLDFSSADGVGRLKIAWSGIEPFYADATPGVFAVIERGNLGSVEVYTSANDNTQLLGRFAL